LRTRTIAYNKLKYLAIILTFYCFALQLDAQVIPHQVDSAGSTMGNVLQRKAGSIDSTGLKIRKTSGKAEHSAQALDSIARKRIAVIDSSALKIENATAASGKYTDSINAVMHKHQSELHARTSALQSKIDSLRKVGLPYHKYSAKLDSLGKVDPAALSRILKPLESIEHAQSKAQDFQNAPVAKVEEKLRLVSGEAEGLGNLPSDVNVPASGLGVDKISVLPTVPKLPGSELNANPGLPGGTQPSLSLPDNSLNKDITSPVDLPDQNVPDLKVVDKIKAVDKIKTGTDQVNILPGKAADLTMDINDIKSGDSDKMKKVEETALSKVPVSNELAEIQKQEQAIKDQQASLESLKKKEAYKKQTLLKAKKVVAVQFAAFEQQLQTSINKVSNYQNKLGTILSRKNDLPKKRDALKKLKTFEKFVYGLTFQIQKPGAWLVDINPSIRYRLTSYWSVGTGWNERVLFGEYDQSYRQTRVFGARTFTEVVIFKGLSFRLDAESMNVFRSPRQRLQDEGQRRWGWSYMAGVKKEFSFVRGILGNAQFMYNVCSSNGNEPYPTRFNVRFGFEYNPKKKLKKK
jgi:hypothetical protein